MDDGLWRERFQGVWDLDMDWEHVIFQEVHDKEHGNHVGLNFFGVFVLFYNENSKVYKNKD